MVRVTVLVLALAAGAAPLRAEVVDVDNDQLTKLIQEGVAVVDIRTPGEWSATGVIEGSHLLTFFDEDGRHDAEAWLADLAAAVGTGAPVVLICHGGGRSSAVSRLLDQMYGSSRVYNAHQGMAEWTARGRQTVESP